MKILQIDHIGVAVANLQEAKTVFSQLFNIQESFAEDVIEQKVKTLGFDIAGSNIEFLEALSEDSPISKFIEKRKNAVHHIALRVDNVDAWIEHLIKNNVEMIDKTARIGAEGKKIAFIHPKATAGILIELAEIKQHE